VVSLAAAAIFFACVAVIAIQLSRVVCADVPPADDGPPPGKPPYAVLTGASALVGAALVYTGAMPLQLGIAALVLFTLVAAWCSDTLCGLVPDVFTLPPLAVLLFFALAQHQWAIVFSAAIAFIPFALAALFSRGRGMGWGDAKLVAVSGAALGLPLVVLTLAVACAAAALVHRIARGAPAPIAFAPYIAAATGLALPLGLIR
jgi:prepilin signal peptidase PulO-like enzyme (type II secretory pathway)